MEVDTFDGETTCINESYETLDFAIVVPEICVMCHVFRTTQASQVLSTLTFLES